MGFRRTILILEIIAILLIFGCTNNIYAQVKENNNFKNSGENSLITQIDKIKKENKEHRVSGPPYVIRGIKTVPTFEPIFKVDENGNIVVDRNLHRNKKFDDSNNGPILYPYKSGKKVKNSNKIKPTE